MKMFAQNFRSARDYTKTSGDIPSARREQTMNFHWGKSRRCQCRRHGWCMKRCGGKHSMRLDIFFFSSIIYYPRHHVMIHASSCGILPMLDKKSRKMDALANHKPRKPWSDLLVATLAQRVQVDFRERGHTPVKSRQGWVCFERSGQAALPCPIYRIVGNGSNVTMSEKTEPVLIPPVRFRGYREVLQFLTDVDRRKKKLPAKAVGQARP